MTDNVDNVNLDGAEASDEVIEDVLALRQLFRARQRRGLRDGGLDLTPLEARLLRLLAHLPDATQSQAAAGAARDKGQVARLIGGLRERGLIETVADQGDRRTQRLRLTRSGLTIEAAVQVQRTQIARQAVQGLDRDEHRQLLALLARVRGNLEALEDGAVPVA